MSSATPTFTHTTELASMFVALIGGRVVTHTSQRVAYNFALDAFDFIENDYRATTASDGPTNVALARAKELREVEHDCTYLLDAFMRILRDNYDYLSSDQQERIVFLGFEL